MAGSARSTVSASDGGIGGGGSGGNGGSRVDNSKTTKHRQQQAKRRFIFALACSIVFGACLFAVRPRKLQRARGVPSEAATSAGALGSMESGGVQGVRSTKADPAAADADTAAVATAAGAVAAAASEAGEAGGAGGVLGPRATLLKASAVQVVPRQPIPVMGEEELRRLVEVAEREEGPCDEGTMLENVLQVPEDALRRGIAYEGDLMRLDMFLHKVTRLREPVTVVVVGSAATLKTAGCKGPQLSYLFGQGVGKTESSGRSVEPRGWLRTALDRLVEAYPPKRLHDWKPLRQELQNQSPAQQKRWDAAGWETEETYWLLNLGVEDVLPSTLGSCNGATFLESLPESLHADLVVVELAHAAVDNSTFLEQYDSILQVVLQRWHNASVVLANFFSFCRGQPHCRSAPAEGSAQLDLNYSSIGIFSFAEPMVELGQGADDVAVDASGGFVFEDNVTVLAQYYSFPAVSARNAFFHLAAQQVEGFELSNVVDEGGGGIVPSVEQSETLYSDLFTWLFRTALQGARRRLAELFIHPRALAVAAHLLKPPHPFFQRWKPSAYEWEALVRRPVRCYGFGEFAVFPEVRADSRSHGFEFEAGGKYDPPRPGLIAKNPGSVIEFLLNTTLPPRTTGTAPNDTVLVPVLELKFLISPDGLGDAKIECRKGCKCAPRRVSGFGPVPLSVASSVFVDVTEAPRCSLRVEVVERDGRVGFRVTGVVVHARALPLLDDGVERSTAVS